MKDEDPDFRVAALVRSRFDLNDETMGEIEGEFPWFFTLGHVTAVHALKRLTVEYYIRSFARTLAAAPHTTFLVFTEDPEWVSSWWGWLREVPIRVIAEPLGGNPSHLALMSLCDGHILSNGVLSWWGAVLSDDNDVIFPKSPPVEFPVKEEWVSL